MMIVHNGTNKAINQDTVPVQPKMTTALSTSKKSSSSLSTSSSESPKEEEDLWSEKGVFLTITACNNSNDDEAVAQLLCTLLLRKPEDTDYIHRVIYHSLQLVSRKIYKNFSFLCRLLEGIPNLTLRSEFFTAICFKFFCEDDDDNEDNNVNGRNDDKHPSLEICDVPASKTIAIASSASHNGHDDSATVNKKRHVQKNIHTAVVIKIIEYYLKKKNEFRVHEKIVNSMVNKFSTICTYENLISWDPSIVENCVLPIILDLLSIEAPVSHRNLAKNFLSHALSYFLKANFTLHENYVVHLCNSVIERNDTENWALLSEYVISKWQNWTLMTRCCLPSILLIDKLIKDVHALTQKILQISPSSLALISQNVDTVKNNTKNDAKTKTSQNAQGTVNSKVVLPTDGNRSVPSEEKELKKDFFVDVSLTGSGNVNNLTKENHDKNDPSSLAQHLHQPCVEIALVLGRGNAPQGNTHGASLQNKHSVHIEKNGNNTCGNNNTNRKVSAHGYDGSSEDNGTFNGDANTCAGDGTNENSCNNKSDKINGSTALFEEDIPLFRDSYAKALDRANHHTCEEEDKVIVTKNEETKIKQNTQEFFLQKNEEIKYNINNNKSALAASSPSLSCAQGDRHDKNGSITNNYRISVNSPPPSSSPTSPFFTATTSFSMSYKIEESDKNERNHSSMHCGKNNTLNTPRNATSNNKSKTLSADKEPEKRTKKNVESLRNKIEKCTEELSNLSTCDKLDYLPEKQKNKNLLLSKTKKPANLFGFKTDK